MADNYLEKKMEALQARKAKEQRARQIATEAEENDTALEDKPVSLAIREVAEGKVSVEM